MTQAKKAEIYKNDANCFVEKPLSALQVACLPLPNTKYPAIFNVLNSKNLVMQILYNGKVEPNYDLSKICVSPN